MTIKQPYIATACDAGCGTWIAAALGPELRKVKPLAALSDEGRAVATAGEV